MVRYRIAWLGCVLALGACGSQSGKGDDSVDDSFCIAEGTLVDTPTGAVPIERLVVGDRVWSVDPTTHERFAATVTHIRSAERECVALNFSGGRLVCTPSHPLLDPTDGTYAPAGEWVLGPARSQLLVVGASAIAARAVTATQVDAGVRRVFDISVDHPLHNFIAGGVVVHNKSYDPCIGDDGSDPWCTTEGTSTTASATTGAPWTTGPDDTTWGPGDGTATTAVDGTTDATTSSAETGTGTGMDSSTGFDSGETTAVCTPVTDDASAVGSDCTGGAMCPDGYTCQPFNGVFLQEQCQILCEDDCECPADHTCNQFIDKVATWMACVPS